MFRRNPGDLEKLANSRKGLIEKKYIEEVPIDDLFRAPPKYEYADDPKGAGPPYPQRKARRATSRTKLSKD